VVACERTLDAHASVTVTATHASTSKAAYRDRASCRMRQ